MIVLLLACGRLAEIAQGGGGGSSGTSAAPAPVPDCASSGESTPARACLSGALACGSTVTGTTLGGDSAYDDDFYAGAFCFPAGDHHSGSERVYTLAAPADTEVVVRLSSSCVDLDLAAVAWEYDGSCPTAKHLISECEGDARRGGNGTVRIESFAPRGYLVVVDGKAGAVGPYTLKVDCRPLRTRDERAAPIK